MSTQPGSESLWSRMMSFRKSQDVGAYAESHLRLMIQKLMRHKLAQISLIVLLVMYLLALFGDMIAPQGLDKYDSEHLNSRPSKLHMVDAQGKFHPNPFVYGLKSARDPVTLRKQFVEDTEQMYPVKWFVSGAEYKFLGLIPGNIHLFGVEDPGRLFLFGTDAMGRDLFSRIILGSQVSLTIPLVGVGISFALGLILGGDIRLLRRSRRQCDSTDY